MALKMSLLQPLKLLSSNLPGVEELFFHAHIDESATHSKQPRDPLLGPDPPVENH